jgi:hypothetical protein
MSFFFILSLIIPASFENLPATLHKYPQLQTTKQFTMQLFRLIIAAAVTGLLSPVLACKCLSNNAATAFCCGHANGIFQFGDDCQSSSINDRFGTFANCCRNSWSLSADCA